MINLSDIDAPSPSGGLVHLGDLSALKQRTVRGKIDTKSILGHPGQDVLYGRPREDGSMLREARRAVEEGTQTDQITGWAPQHP